MIQDRKLSARQREVACLISQGKSNKEIAYEMHIAYGTVKQYVNNIFTTLGVRNRTELAMFWVKEYEISDTDSQPVSSI